MICIIGWVRYISGEVLLSFIDPETCDFDNSLIIACGNDYEEGDKRTYLKTITTEINPSFWDYFTADELDALIDDADDIAFEMCMLKGSTRTLVKTNAIFTQESESEDIKDEDIENKIKTDRQIVSKQKSEVFYSSISSLI